MSLEMLKLRLALNADPCFLLSAHRLTELMLLGSAAYFLIATEQRFNEGDLDGTRLKVKNSHGQPGQGTSLSACKVRPQPPRSCT
jgi:hypothetical protein